MKRAELCVTFEKDIKKNGYPIFHFFPDWKTPKMISALFARVVKETGDENLAGDVVAFALKAEHHGEYVGDRFENDVLTAEVNYW